MEEGFKMIDANTSLQDLMNHAKNEVQHVSSTDRDWIVRDLFKGYEWNRIKVGNRTKLGSMFFSYATNEGSAIIQTLGKTPQNQQQYRKI